MQLDPPDIVQAEEAFANASQSADSDADRSAIALATAQTYLEKNNPEKAQAVVISALEQFKEISDARFQLCIMQGNLKLQANDTAGAESAYKEVTETFPSAPKETRLAAQASYREACKRLAQLYKQAKRRKEMGELIQKNETRNRQTRPRHHRQRKVGYRKKCIQQKIPLIIYFPVSAVIPFSCSVITARCFVCCSVIFDDYFLYPVKSDSDITIGSSTNRFSSLACFNTCFNTCSMRPHKT